MTKKKVKNAVPVELLKHQKSNVGKECVAGSPGL